MVGEPNRNAARKRLSELLVVGDVSFTAHAKAEMSKDKLTSLDVENVLRLGRILRVPEVHDGQWRYRVETDAIAVVVTMYEKKKEVRVITAWRARR